MSVEFLPICYRLVADLLPTCPSPVARERRKSRKRNVDICVADASRAV